MAGPHYSRAARHGVGSVPQGIDDLLFERIIRRILVGAIARNQLAVPPDQVLVEVPVGRITVGSRGQPLEQRHRIRTPHRHPVEHGEGHPVVPAAHLGGLVLVARLLPQVMYFIKANGTLGC